MIGDTWYPTASKINLKYLLSYSSNYKAKVHQLDYIGAFLQGNVEHRDFVRLGSRYGEHLPEYANYFRRPLSLNKSIYGMNNSGKLFSDELTNWLIEEAGFNH